MYDTHVTVSTGILDTGGDASGSRMRHAPQQARGVARVRAILDAAEATIAELGYEAATTNHIAEAAGISVGSLYRWFPDKESIAQELVRSHLDRVAARAFAAFERTGAEPTPTLVRAVVHAVATQWLATPAISVLVAVSLGPRPPDSPAAPLRQMLLGQVAALLESRVPSIPIAERDVVARTCISLLEGALLDAAGDEAHRSEIVEEAAYAIAAYLAMKYPFEDSHRWRQPMEGLPPSRISVQ